MQYLDAICAEILAFCACHSRPPPFIGIYTRIAEYGFTPERYLLVLFGVWMVWLFVGALKRHGGISKVSIIGSIAAALIVSSIGPWGSQVFRFMTKRRSS